MFKQLAALATASVAALSISMPAKAEVGTERAVTLMSNQLVQFVHNLNRQAGTQMQPPQIMLTQASRIYGGCNNGKGTEQQHYTGYRTDNTGSHWCALTNTIVIDFDQAESFRNNYGDGSVVYIVAHEFAHWMQFQFGITPQSKGGIVNYELQADCMAGSILRAAAPNIGWDYNKSDNYEVLRAAANIGDSTHGTGQQRKDAVMLGFNGGIKSCGLR